MESRTRSIVKATLWTVIGFLVMTIVGFVMTGSIGMGGVMAFVNSAIGLLSYVVYERVWAGIGWGRDA